MQVLDDLNFWITFITLSFSVCMQVCIYRGSLQFEFYDILSYIQFFNFQHDNFFLHLCNPLSCLWEYFLWCSATLALISKFLKFACFQNAVERWEKLRPDVNSGFSWPSSVFLVCSELWEAGDHISGPRLAVYASIFSFKHGSDPWHSSSFSHSQVHPLFWVISFLKQHLKYL